MEAREAAAARGWSLETENLYRSFKARLIEELPQDPRVMEIVISQPELQVQVQRSIVTVDGASTKGRVARLIANDYFKDTRRFSEVLRELERTGTRINNKSLSVALQDLVVTGFLTNEGAEGYRGVSSMKVNIVEAA